MVVKKTTKQKGRGRPPKKTQPKKTTQPKKRGRPPKKQEPEKDEKFKNIININIEEKTKTTTRRRRAATPAPARATVPVSYPYPVPIRVYNNSPYDTLKNLRDEINILNKKISSTKDNNENVIMRNMIKEELREKQNELNIDTEKELKDALNLERERDANQARRNIIMGTPIQTSTEPEQIPIAKPAEIIMTEAIQDKVPMAKEIQVGRRKGKKTEEEKRADAQRRKIERENKELLIRLGRFVEEQKKNITAPPAPSTSEPTEQKRTIRRMKKK